MSQTEWIAGEDDNSMTLFIDGEETEWTFTKKLVGRYENWVLKNGKQTLFAGQISDQVIDQQVEDFDRFVRLVATTLALADDEYQP